MSRLIGPMFAGSPLLLLPLISLVIFFLTFAAVLLRTYRRKATDYADIERLPLDDGGEEDR